MGLSLGIETSVDRETSDFPKTAIGQKGSHESGSGIQDIEIEASLNTDSEMVIYLKVE